MGLCCVVLVVLTAYLWPKSPVVQPHIDVQSSNDHPDPFRLLEKYDTIIFFHVPKTGGTSLRSVIEKYCIKENISMQVHYDSINTFNPDLTPRVIYGHNAFYPSFHQSYLVPKNKTYKYISLIRHPRERIVSHFKEFRQRGVWSDHFFPGARDPCNYIKADKKGASKKVKHFSDFVRCFPDFLGCYQWKMITGMHDIECTKPYHPLMSDEEVIREGLKVVAKDFILLPIEDSDQSLQYILCAMGFRCPQRDDNNITNDYDHRVEQDNNGLIEMPHEHKRILDNSTLVSTELIEDTLSLDLVLLDYACALLRPSSKKWIEGTITQREEKKEKNRCVSYVNISRYK